MGYIGYSRSVRSMEAIENFEMPLSLITKKVIDNFLIETEEFSAKEISLLKKATVKMIKLSAVESGRSSWHHTSNHFNKTDHYSLEEACGYLLKHFEAIKEASKAQPKQENFKFGVCEVQIWGGTSRHPKLMGTENVAGLVKGDWLHSLYKKYKISANKTVADYSFESYSELVKKFPEFKGTKSNFTKIAKKLYHVDI